MFNSRNRKTKRIPIIALLLVCGTVIFSCFNVSTGIQSRIGYIDKTLLNGQLRNFYGKLIGENWGTIPLLKFGTLPSSTFLLIAHGNGFRSDKLENSREGFQLSKAHGLKHFEIDIWANDRAIYCSHEIIVDDDICDLSVLFKGLEANDTIIIDVKTEFAMALQALVTSQDAAILKRVIVQLYNPADAAVFLEFSSHFDGALFTLYRSNRRLEHICNSLDPDNFPVIVINKSKLHQAERACPDHRFIVHPVKHCEELAALQAKSNVRGALVSNKAINCKI